MAAARPSIRRDLLVRLLLMLLLVVLLSGALAYGLARYFSHAVFDQWLHDSAISLANRVSWKHGSASVDLPEGARQILEWDEVDLVYYEVISARGERLLGNAFLPAPPFAADAGPVYYNTLVGGAQVRVLAIAREVPDGDPVTVKVAETQRKRELVASQVLSISVSLSLVLAAVCAVLLWYATGRGMSSIEAVVRDVRRTHAAMPLSQIPVDDNLPVEVLPFVHEINGLIENLSSANLLNQRFVADAAHQLRTPVASLQVRLESALRESDPALHRRALEDALRLLVRLGRSVHQLLTLAKADESNASMISGRPIDLDLIAREEVERRLDEALAAGIDLGYEGPGTRVPVHGIDDLVREAVANTLDNALRYSGPGARVTVGIVASTPEIYVEDDGPGVAPADRTKVMERFYRLPRASGEGCGLGLAIVKEIVQRHGGSLLLEDSPAGQGLRVRLLFPIALPPAPTTRTTRRAETQA